MKNCRVHISIIALPSKCAGLLHATSAAASVTNAITKPVEMDHNGTARCKVCERANWMRRAFDDIRNSQPSIEQFVISKVKQKERRVQANNSANKTHDTQPELVVHRIINVSVDVDAHQLGPRLCST